MMTFIMKRNAPAPTLGATIIFRRGAGAGAGPCWLVDMVNGSLPGWKAVVKSSSGNNAVNVSLCPYFGWHALRYSEGRDSLLTHALRSTSGRATHSREGAE